MGGWYGIRQDLSWLAARHLAAAIGLLDRVVDVTVLSRPGHRTA